MALENQQADWWKSTVFYHIYIRSFYDSNGDGIGDLQGIIDHLDYVKDLGAGAIWVSPFVESPQKDFGYDISNYTTVSPLFGDMDLFDCLLQEVHRRDMKLILDLVLNHTSDQHPWFLESASSRDNPKADWYVWKDGKGRKGKKYPNNWRAMSGNRAWNYHPQREQFYYSGFLPFQPDLNYNNPEVKEAIFDMVRFWLEKGVDGFRLDIISAIYEDPNLTNNPCTWKLFPSDHSLTILFQNLKHNFLQEKSFGFATELRQVVDEYSDRFIIGETHGDEQEIKKFCQYQGQDGLHAIFLFKAISTPFKAKSYYQLIKVFEEHFAEPLMPTYVFGNHDRVRIMKRLGNQKDKSRLHTLFQFTVRGVPFIYYGEEIGMTQARIPLKQAQDPIGIRNQFIPQFIVNLSMESLNRDECRTPMQWNSKSNAGFCPEDVKPWLPVSLDYPTVNVAYESSQKQSLLNFYKQCLTLRNETPALHSGSLTLIDALCNKHLLSYSRERESDYFLIILNLSNNVEKIPSISGDITLCTHDYPSEKALDPWEGRVIKINKNTSFLLKNNPFQ